MHCSADTHATHNWNALEAPRCMAKAHVDTSQARWVWELPETCSTICRGVWIFETSNNTCYSIRFAARFYTDRSIRIFQIFKHYDCYQNSSISLNSRSHPVCFLGGACEFVQRGLEPVRFTAIFRFRAFLPNSFYWGHLFVKRWYVKCWLFS